MGEIKVVLQYAAALCLVFAASWIWRAKKDRSRGVLMGIAFVVMSALLFGYGSDWPMLAIYVLLGILVLLLMGDFALRAARQVEEKK